MRRRIALLVVATTSVVVASFVIPLCLLVRTLAEDRALAAADQAARNVALFVANADDDRELRSLLASLGPDPQVSVLTARGQQLGGGPPMVGDPDVERALEGEAFRVVRDDGGAVLQPVALDQGTVVVVRSLVLPEDLRHGVPQAWAGILGLGLVLTGASVAIAMRLGRRVSEPLLQVARTAHQLREGDLSARAEVRGSDETQELARALNGLAERTAELLAAERAAVGDLSHRLRTPVTALRLDAEAVADAGLRDRLQEHIAVLVRTVDAIVREARRPVRSTLSARCDAAAVVAARVAFWQPLAEDQGRPLDVRLEAGPMPVGLAEDDLRDLVDIVVDNVFAHTPDGTPFRVELHREPGPRHDHAVLLVADSGSGFSERRARPGTTGLGLEIAARTADDAGGSLLRRTAVDGGAVVEVLLPISDD